MEESSYLIFKGGAATIMIMGGEGGVPGGQNLRGLGPKYEILHPRSKPFPIYDYDPCAIDGEGFGLERGTI